MKISVKVKPRSRENLVRKIDDNHFIVLVKAAPVEGKANIAVIECLAEYFDLPKWNIQIISGNFSKNKIVEVLKD